MAAVIEQIAGPEEDGTEVLIVRNSDGKRFNAVFRDADTDQTVVVYIVDTIEKARDAARKMLYGAVKE